MPAKTVKKQSKLGAFFSRLNPNSPKKKLLLFVLVFAVLGGGYYAYSSFAASITVRYNATVFSGRPVYGDSGLNSNTTLVNTTISGKGTVKVLRVGSSSSGGSISRKVTAPRGWVKVCVYAKRPSSSHAHASFRLLRPGADLIHGLDNGSWSTTNYNSAKCWNFVNSDANEMAVSIYGSSAGKEVFVNYVTVTKL